MLRAVMTCETPDYWKDHFQKHGVQDVPVFYEQIAPGMAKIASLNAHCWLDLPREFEKRYPNFEGQIESLIARMPGIKREEDGYVSFTAMEEYPDAPESLCLNAYGVVDSPDQFQEDFRETLEADPRDFFVAFTEIRKDEQPETGGWRWHKWGPYYGTQKPMCEYIADEPEIESVYLFHIYEL